LGELIEYDFSRMHVMQLYRVSDQLLKHKVALEEFLYGRERTLFEFDEVITLYDLTNTYFEGTGGGNANAALGRSKEKRSDCPLVTLALVLDGSGFPKRSEVFAGNASEPQTLAQMVNKLTAKEADAAPTVVLDAGLATEENIAWLVEHDYRYLVVSRKRHREFNAEEAVLVKGDGDLRVYAQRIVNARTGEVELYCHSSQREKKERGIAELFARRYEEALDKLAAGLHKKGTVKRYDKVLQRLGRLKQKYSRAARYYEVSVEHDPDSGKDTRPSTTPCPVSTACAPIKPNGTRPPCGGPIPCSPTWRRSSAASNRNWACARFTTTKPNASVAICSSRYSPIIWFTPFDTSSRPVISTLAGTACAGNWMVKTASPSNSNGKTARPYTSADRPDPNHANRSSTMRLVSATDPEKLRKPSCRYHHTTV
jgi:hypothetical protein